MTMGQRAEQLRYAIQLYARSLDEEKVLMIATVFDQWKPDGHSYEVGEYCAYGEDKNGDPVLYACLQAHVSQPDWTPDTASGLFKKVGFTEEGYPEWSQPVGASDAYMKDDVVSYEGNLYISLIDNNVWSPTVYPAGWEIFVEPSEV